MMRAVDCPYFALNKFEGLNTTFERMLYLDNIHQYFPHIFTQNQLTNVLQYDVTKIFVPWLSLVYLDICHIYILILSNMCVGKSSSRCNNLFFFRVLWAMQDSIFIKDPFLAHHITRSTRTCIFQQCILNNNQTQSSHALK